MADHVALPEELLEDENGNGDIEMEGAENAEDNIEVDIETGEDGALLPDVTDLAPKRIMFLEYVTLRRIHRGREHYIDA